MQELRIKHQFKDQPPSNAANILLIIEKELVFFLCFLFFLKFIWCSEFLFL